VTASAADQRAKTIALTDLGRELVVTFTPAHEAHIDDALAGLNPSERDDLLRLLGQLGGHLEHRAGCGSAAEHASGRT
jgi:DNA-binding MarR family transcriptional regulator